MYQIMVNMKMCKKKVKLINKGWLLVKPIKKKKNSSPLPYERKS